MMMWLLLMVFMLALSVAGLLYLVRRFHRFSFMKSFDEKSKIAAWTLSVCPVVIVVGVFWILINVYAAIIVLVHLMIFWMICDLIGHIIRRCMRKEFKRNVEGVVAVIITIAYMSMGWYYAHHVYETDYTFTTDKELNGGTLRVVEIADSHMGITLDGKQFAKEMKKVQKVNPDVVVIAGDFVDDDSCKTDMVEACRALGELRTKYGVYFIYGNHDKGYYDYRDFSSQELREELIKNNVVILEDERILIDDSFYIIGRQDRSVENRMDMNTLTQGLDTSKYMILLDHQPNDYDNEAATDVDLVLSGHTHGGHIFPAGQIGLLIKANDRVYGKEVRNDTTFVVTSGISGWAIPFKTGTISEFVVIDIVSEQ